MNNPRGQSEGSEAVLSSIQPRGVEIEVELKEEKKLRIFFLFILVDYISKTRASSLFHVTQSGIAAFWFHLMLKQQMVVKQTQEAQGIGALWTANILA